MTLAVARIDGPRVAIASDTLLTEHDKPLPIQNGVVKSCMVPGDICVSFCNSPETAGKALQEFVARYPRGAGFADVIAFFEKSSADTGNDYLIAFSSPARVAKIAEGKYTPSLSKTQWIGDRDAYEAFQFYAGRKKKRPQQGRAINAAMFMDELKDSPASDLYSAMRNVVLDRSVPSAGGFVTTISNRDNGFRYSVYSDMLFDWPAGEPEEYEFAYTDKISLQVSGENAKFSIAQISPGYMGLNLVAYYFSKARKLFFFHGDWIGLPLHCEVFENIPPAEIHYVLNRFIGQDLGWLLTILSPQAADAYLDQVQGIETPGSKLAFLCEANTFPPSAK
ncbi:hypothetical protein [Bradyrhizobium sp. SZCCHNRI1073]|uniref:hypothetical protein n=1 Tax=Bradyrhizobium sp. SZCCHNRI1073 TaxID=3057280 RepID=UPI002916FF57|nr:hypothetical protein [Bradyrhizobium sp. SZCCHNRI1073]